MVQFTVPHVLWATRKIQAHVYPKKAPGDRGECSVLVANYYLRSANVAPEV